MKDEMAYMADKPNVRELQGELNRSISDLHDISALDDVRFAKWDGHKYSYVQPQLRELLPTPALHHGRAPAI